MSSSRPIPPPPANDPLFLRFKRRTLGYCFTLLLASTFAVLIRFYCKYRANRGKKIELDDIWIFLSWLFFVGIMAVNIWQAFVGGKDYPLVVLPLHLQKANLQSGYWGAVLFGPCITFAKLSVLQLYLHLFGVIRPFVRFVYIVLATCIAYAIAHTLVFIFRCTPVREAWNPATMQRDCMSANILLASLEPINALQDLIIVAMPLFVIRTLNLSRRKKVSLSLVFLGGTFVVVASVVRIVLTIAPKNQAVALRDAAKIGHIQLCLAIVFSCVLTYGPIYAKIGGFDRLRALYYAAGSRFSRSGSSGRSRGSRAREGDSNQSRSDRYNNLPHPGNSTTILSESDLDQSLERNRSDESYPLDTILVKHSLQVTPEIRPPLPVAKLSSSSQDRNI